MKGLNQTLATFLFRLKPHPRCFLDRTWDFGHGKQLLGGRGGLPLFSRMGFEGRTNKTSIPIPHLNTFLGRAFVNERRLVAHDRPNDSTRRSLRLRSHEEGLGEVQGGAPRHRPRSDLRLRDPPRSIDRVRSPGRRALEMEWSGSSEDLVAADPSAPSLCVFLMLLMGIGKIR